MFDEGGGRREKLQACKVLDSSPLLSGGPDLGAQPGTVVSGVGGCAQLSEVSLPSLALEGRWQLFCTWRWDRGGIWCFLLILCGCSSTLVNEFVIHHQDPRPAMCKGSRCSHSCRDSQSWSQSDCRSQMWGHWLVVCVLGWKREEEWCRVEGRDLVSLGALPVTLWVCGTANPLDTGAPGSAQVVAPWELSRLWVEGGA